MMKISKHMKKLMKRERLVIKWMECQSLPQMIRAIVQAVERRASPHARRHWGPLTGRRMEAMDIVMTGPLEKIYKVSFGEHCRTLLGWRLDARFTVCVCAVWVLSLHRESSALPAAMKGSCLIWHWWCPCSAGSPRGRAWAFAELFLGAEMEMEPGSSCFWEPGQHSPTSAAPTHLWSPILWGLPGNLTAHPGL